MFIIGTLIDSSNRHFHYVGVNHREDLENPLIDSVQASNDDQDNGVQLTTCREKTDGKIGEYSIHVSSLKHLLWEPN